MICLFEKDAMDFTGNGICVLDPSVCTVSEVAGGSYTLYMEHPMDEYGKYLMLTDERIIKAPVPPKYIKEIVLPPVTVWQTTEATDLYATLPSSGKSKKQTVADDVKRAKQNPQAFAWRPGVVYRARELVTDNGNVYRAKSQSYNVPPPNTSYWNFEAAIVDPSDETQTGGKVIESLASGVNVYKIADYNGTYMQVRAMSGKVGYIRRSACAETELPESEQIIPAQKIETQLFRIEKIECEDDTKNIVVNARHISYDFAGNVLYSCQVIGVEPMTAISIMKGSLLDEDDRIIACDITGQTISKDWSFINPINALLDPDAGLVPTLGAQLIRNNQNIYIVSNDSPNRGMKIVYGINMLGVKWTRSTENVITRVLPRCDDGNKGYLYLDDIYVESAHSSQFAFQRTEVMDCDYTVGESYDKPDGTTATWTEESAKAQMQADAQARFDTDNVDAVEVELDVEFLLLGDTEEYAQYRGLQSVSLYDEVTVETGPSNMVATAQIAEYEYDSILKRYNSIHVGDVKSMQRRIPGYRLKKGSITYDKLGSNIISRIKGANTSGQSSD